MSNSGLFVFHYGYAIARWYDGWRCTIQENGLRKSIVDSSFFNHDPDLGFDLRHQISALIVCLDKIDNERNVSRKYSTTNVISREQECSDREGPLEKRIYGGKIKRTSALRNDIADKQIKRGSTNVVGTSIATRNSMDGFMLRNKTIKCPSLHSFHMNASGVDQSLIKSYTTFVKYHMSPFSNYFYPIKPSTNSCRMNYQSKQAIRVFFGKTMNDNDKSKDTATRAVYGPLAVLKSTGAHPSHQYRVLPFTDRIQKMASELMSFLKSKGIPICSGSDFNFLEVKIYIGDDIFKDKHNEVISDYNGNPLRLGCNKQVSVHNDLNFSDEGVQSDSDTACSDHPTVTVTIGASRRLFFERLTKKIDDNGWCTLANEHSVSFDLRHGSIFVLSPEDDKPCNLSRSDETKYKTKHGVQFTDDGVSFAFVFRRVKTSSKFHPKDNTWLWQRESREIRERIKSYVKNNESEYNDVVKEFRAGEMKQLERNIKKYVSTI